MNVKRRALLLTVSRLLFLFFAAVFLIVSVLLAARLYRERKEQQAFERLSAIVSEETRQPEKSDEQPDSLSGDGVQREEITKLDRYRQLYAMNSDFFGWISVAGTPLNYPVMYKPDREDYYLRRAFDGSKSLSGVPYIEESCFPGCGNYLIYGHYMKNGTVFAAVTSYESQSFWEEHPTISFDTLDGEGEYKVMAAFDSRVYAVDEKNVFRYYQYTDLSDPEVFAEYVSLVQKHALYDTGVTAEYGDELITLSTCSYKTNNGRFVVVACKQS